jgi:uncharacterized protein (DUF2342 family)
VSQTSNPPSKRIDNALRQVSDLIDAAQSVASDAREMHHTLNSQLGRLDGLINQVQSNLLGAMSYIQTTLEDSTDPVKADLANALRQCRAYWPETDAPAAIATIAALAAYDAEQQESRP